MSTESNSKNFYGLQNGKIYYRHVDNDLSKSSVSRQRKLIISIRSKYIFFSAETGKEKFVYILYCIPGENWREEISDAIKKDLQLFMPIYSGTTEKFVKEDTKNGFDLPLIFDITDLNNGTDEFIFIPKQCTWQKIEDSQSVDGCFENDSPNSFVRNSTSRLDVRLSNPLVQISSKNAHSEEKLANSRKCFCQTLKGALPLFKRRTVPLVKMTKAALLRCGSAKVTSGMKRTAKMEKLCVDSSSVGVRKFANLLKPSRRKIRERYCTFVSY